MPVDAFARGADENAELLLRDVHLRAEIGGERTEPARESHRERLYRSHQLAIKTKPGTGRREPLVFEWGRTAGRASPLRPERRTSYLSFYDTAGEDVAANARIEDLAYFKAARALIFMLDPFMLDGAVQTVNLPKGAVKPSEKPPSTIRLAPIT